MGLDMFLYKRAKVKESQTEPTEIMYWRKANQIRQWFVDNTGYDAAANCKEHPVTKERLTQLRDDCLKVIETHKKNKNHRTSRKLLPSSDGFFFGGTEYDRWYYDEVERTARELTEILRTVNFNTYEVFYYEWW